MKSKNFNIVLRGKVLEKALILEELSSSIIKLILRLLWDDTKTLSNQSSSLSFKNKIDLLYDLQDISKEEHVIFIKIMEVRNQFAHNFDCNLWEDFKRINPSVYEYISKKFPNDDISFSTSFRDMFKFSHKKLLEIENKYKNGLSIEIEKIITNEVYSNVDKIAEISVNNWLEWCREINISVLGTSFSEEEFKLDGLKKIIIQNFLKYREKLYIAYNAMPLNDFKETLKRKVDNNHVDEYLNNLNNKYKFAYNKEWDELSEDNEILEDDYYIHLNKYDE